MFLAVDIGNSNIKFGLYEGSEIIERFAIPTDRGYSAEILGEKLAGRFAGAIERCLICSVVPELNSPLSTYLENFPIPTHVITNNDNFGLEINYEPLSAAGTDRLVNSFSAAEKYGSPCIVCSFGTAMTIDVVDGNKRLVGGLIAPGLKVLVKALSLTTSRLPEIEIQKPERVIQNNTLGSIQSGVVNGYFSQFEGLLRKVKDELGEGANVIATGGHAPLVAANCSGIDHVYELLTLDGIRLLADRL